MYRAVLCVVFVLCCCACLAASSPSGGKIRRTADTHVTVCNKDRSVTDDPSLLPLFHRHPANGSSLKVCAAESSCCKPQLEEKFLELIGSNYEKLLWRHSQSLYRLLKNTEDAVDEHVFELVQQSENKTLTVFSQVYQTMSVLATDSVTKMYSSILRQATSKDRPSYDADIAVLDFFQDVFPLVYHNIVNPRLRDYSRSYKKCLRDAWLEIKPYGDIPKELAAKVDQTMSSVRIFLQALRVGSGAVNKTLQMSVPHRCREELVRLSMCPWCQNVRVRPCSGYCLNVLRGCLTHMSVLDLPWTGFVDALQQLLSRQVSTGPTNLPINQLVSRLDEVVRSLDIKISEAIMKAMMEGTHLEEKAKKICGAPSWSDDDSQPSPPEVIMQPDMLEPTRIKVTPHSAGKRFTEKLRESEKRVSSELQHFLDNIGKFQTYYGNMAENVCSDESFAHTKDTYDCWNGHRVGEYSKTVVAAGVSAQRYNPELPLIDDVSDPDIRDLSEHLRTMRQVIMSQLIRHPESDSFMRDEEGSGGGFDMGGVRYPPGDDEENWDGNEGSGSGESAIDGNTIHPREGSIDETRTTAKPGSSSGASMLPSALQLTIAAILAHRNLRL